MSFEQLDPRITLKLLEGRRDVISPLAEKREKFYAQQECPNCGGNSLTKIGDPDTMFRDGDPLPRYTLNCDNCDCLFDPHSGILLSIGNKAAAYEPSIPLLEGPED